MSSKKARSELPFAIAIALPLMLGIYWLRLPPILQSLPGYLFLIVIGVVARVFGFRPAIGAIGTAGPLFWFHVIPNTFGTGAPGVVRLILFLTAAALIASLSRRLVRDVHESEERYRTLVELSPDGMSLSDQSGKILFANSGLARLLRAGSAEELIGRRYVDFAHPDSKDVVRERMARLAMGESPPPLEEKWIRFDGTVLEVECAAAPMSWQGHMVGQIVTRDLTPRKQAEAAIEESSRRLRAMFDMSTEAILFLDANGFYVDANAAASDLLGYSRDEFLTKKLGDFTPPSRRDEVLAIWARLGQSGSVKGEFVIVRKDGAEVPIDYRAVANVRPGLHYVVMHDITERKRSEESLRRLSIRLIQSQDEERRRIARQLHETSVQSLAALRMNLATLADSGTRPDTDARQQLIRESMDLTDQTLKEIRTLSYLLHPPLMEEFGLVPTLQWYASGFQQRSGVTTTVEASEDIGRLPDDIETAVFRIAQEALTNIKRHSGSSVATIRLSVADGEVSMEVADQGHGLPEAVRGQPPSRVAALGVGLAGMNERVSELGGRLEMDSDDHGTKIRVTLPLEAAHRDSHHDPEAT